MSRLATLADFALFQLTWFVCVTQAAQGQPARGIAAVALFVLLQLVRSTNRRADALLLALAVAIGVIWDTGLLQAGFVRYASPGPVVGVAPIWILAMWALLAAVLRGPLHWLQGRPVLAAVLGSVGGPASYAAAARLGACSFGPEPFATAALATGWAIFTPLLIEAARWLDTPAALAGAARS